MSYVPVTLANFKSRFDRDFAFSADQTDMTMVRDKDITTAFTQAAANFNEGLFSSQDVFAEAFSQLTAHYLCVNLLNSSQGLGGTANWLTNSKSIGNISEGFTIPERISRSPILSVYSKTSYGMTYLSIILPLLVGNVGLVQGDTTP